jgi:hypothetical protein
MVSKEEFLKFKQERHKEMMLSVQEDEKELLKIPYLDNIP